MEFGFFHRHMLAGAAFGPAPWAAAAAAPRPVSTAKSSRIKPLKSAKTGGGAAPFALFSASVSDL